ncbi:MAG: UxaA family hydrolase [Spirochaetes bacterium]|nr:UxaA family hydrolase [Spirochaetota bacterium]
MKTNVMVINEKDNVVVAAKNIAKGETVSLPGGETFPALADIPYGHKVACRDIADGQDIIKYGELIGRAKGLLKKGEWIHLHNLIIEE